MKKYQVFRKKYPRFIYRNYRFSFKNNDLTVSFVFQIEPGIIFRPKIKVKNIPRLEEKNLEVLENLIFHLGLIELFSYWKATCSPEIIIEPGYLNKNQIKWWQNLLIKGMGEYFYTNKIDFRSPNFVRFIIENKKKFKAVNLNIKGYRILIPVGGGKDSVVTLEIIKSCFENVNCFCLNPSKASLDILKVVNIRKPVIVERQIDPLLLDLNSKGFLNGHTPFSAYLHFLSLLTAYIFDYNSVAFSNEKSADEGNVNYLGHTINHQYSKSSDFEEKFRKYYKKYILKDIEVYSFLRYLSELEISYLFSNFKEYFSVFRSCNKGIKKNVWCNQCPKCLSTFISLYPFLEKDELLKIFGKNLFADKKLLPILKQLLGEKKKPKPFECVMTRREIRQALEISYEKEKETKKLPPLLDYFKKHFIDSD